MIRDRRPTRSPGALRILVCAGAALSLLAAAAPAAAGERERRGHDARERERGIRVLRHGPPIRMTYRDGRVGHRAHRRDAHDRREHRKGRHHGWREPRCDHDRHGRWETHRRGHHDHGRHRHRGHGWGHAKRHPGHGWGHGKHHREHHHVRSHSARRHTGWLCRPCAHRFSSSYLFRRHLHLFHDVPPHRIPHVVVKVDLGWIFAG